MIPDHIFCSPCPGALPSCQSDSECPLDQYCSGETGWCTEGCRDQVTQFNRAHVINTLSVTNVCNTQHIKNTFLILSKYIFMKIVLCSIIYIYTVLDLLTGWVLYYARRQSRLLQRPLLHCWGLSQSTFNWGKLSLPRSDKQKDDSCRWRQSPALAVRARVAMFLAPQEELSSL